MCGKEGSFGVYKGNLLHNYLNTSDQFFLGDVRARKRASKGMV